jgi:hypothetical protein
MTDFTPRIDIRNLYDLFDMPVTEADCGKMCASHNSSGEPFCCDINQAVPAAWIQEWQYLQEQPQMWQTWNGKDGGVTPDEAEDLIASTPEHMCLLSCMGIAQCQRKYRAMSCRQFPFFPYINSRGEFLGLAYYWNFENTCWVLSHLDQVTAAYRKAFVQVYDQILAVWDAEFESYAICSEDAREYFAEQERRILLLHRYGGFYMIDSLTERMEAVNPEQLPRFGPYSNI